jgi:hypothetical protein
MRCYQLGMGIRPRDTSPAAWAIVERGIRAMTPTQRVERAAALTVLAHSFALAQIRQDHPNESEREHKLRLAARYIDAATMKAAFGWPRD